MKAERVQVGLKMEATDGSQIEIVRGWFKHEGFDSIEYKFLSGQFAGQTEICAVAFIQEAVEGGNLKEIK